MKVKFFIIVFVVSLHFFVIQYLSDLNISNQFTQITNNKIKKPIKVQVIDTSFIKLQPTKIEGTQLHFSSETIQSEDVPKQYFSINKAETPNNLDANNLDANNLDTNNLDTNNLDTNNLDTNNLDTNNSDANNLDANNLDANNLDANNLDANNLDTNNSDANNLDANNLDTNNLDTNNSDANNSDASNSDASNSDANNSDANNSDANNSDIKGFLSSYGQQNAVQTITNLYDTEEISTPILDDIMYIPNENLLDHIIEPINMKLPYELRQLHNDWNVTVTLFVDENGKIMENPKPFINPTLSSGNAEIDHYAIQNSLKAKFKPLKRDGQSIVRQISINLEYKDIP